MNKLLIMDDPLERERSFKREIKLQIKDLSILIVYCVGRLAAIFKPSIPLNKDVIFRFDGLGDHIISATYIKKVINREKMIFMFNDRWLGILKEFDDFDEIELFPVKVKNPFKYVFSLAQYSARNAIALNSTPDIVELITYLSFNRGKAINISSFANLSRLAILFLKIYRIKFVRVLSETEHDYQVKILYNHLAPLVSQYQRSDSKDDGSVVIMAETSNIRKDLDINSLIKFSINKIPNAKIYYIIGLSSKVRINFFDTRIRDLRGQTSLKDLYYLIKNADSYIGADTGMMHLANYFNLNIHVFIGQMHGFWFYPKQDGKSYFYTNSCPYSPCNYYCHYDSNFGDKSTFRCIQSPPDVRFN